MDNPAKQNVMAKRAHNSSKSKGFWSETLSNEHCLMLVITEVSEMVEADRKNDRAGIAACLMMKQDMDKGETFETVFESYVKNTVEDEMADVVIRLYDLAGRLGIDFEKLMPCRYHRAFDKFTFTENAFALCKGLSKEKIALVKRIQFALDYVRNWAKSERIDLKWHVEAKMKYNAGRAALHGKKY